MFTMITRWHNCDDGYIALVNIGLDGLPEKMVVDGVTLLKKSEFHISIMALKHLAPLIDSENVEQMHEQLKQDFIDFVDVNDLTNFTLIGEYRLVRRDERITLVAMVHLEGVDDLFQYLSQKYAIQLPVQPTHITLYTLRPEEAIGILSEEQLEGNSMVLEVPELKQVTILS